MFICVLFLILCLSCAVMGGISAQKKPETNSALFKIFRTVFAILSAIGLVTAFGPDKSVSGTGFTAALNNITGGWSGAVILAFIYVCVLNVISIGVTVLAKKNYRNKHMESGAPSKRKSLVPKIILILFSGIAGIMYIPGAISELLKLFRYASKQDGIHYVRFEGFNVMSLSWESQGLAGIDPTYYTVGLGYVGLVFLICSVLCVCFIASVISLINSIRKPAT